MATPSRYLEASRELKSILENGYEIIQRKNIYRTPRIAKSGEPGWTKDNFMRAVLQGYMPRDYDDWKLTLSECFEKYGMSYLRFRRITEDYDETKESHLPAAQFKRDVDELDKVVNDEARLMSYALTDEFSPVEYREGTVRQGYRTHKFTDTHAIKLLEMLWERRRIKSSKGGELKKEQPTERSDVYDTLKITHARFQTVVRGVHVASKRKGIKLEIRYPKTRDIVYIEVTQDVM